MTDLVTRARAGDVRALARLLTVLEGDWREGASEAMRLLSPHAGRAHVVGITGPPGVGKSTLVDRLLAEFTAPGSEHRIAVLAFDPSSPFTGGALLGDRVRMGRRALEPGVFIRSVANRAHAGGLSRTAARLVTALDAVGYDRILLETVGAGQSEVDVAALAQTVVLVLAPGLGDEIQALKAGILETAHILAVNKGDLPGADRVLASLGDSKGDRTLLKVSAATGQGVPELAAAIVAHAEVCASSPAGETRRRVHARLLLEDAIREGLWRRFVLRHGAEKLSQMSERVGAGEIDPESAAEVLLEE